MSIRNKLKSILEGNLLLEAEEDKYDLENQDDNSSENDDNADQPDTSDQNDNENQENDDNKGEENNQDDENEEESGDPDYGLDDDNDEEQETNEGGDEPSTSDSETADNPTDNSGSSPNQEKPGSLLNIDAKSRSILTFKNFERYRNLRDDTGRLINELSEFVPTSDEARQYLLIAVEKGNDLFKKLNDYILYKYIDNSYEVNYNNYMQFILEKRYLDELYRNIIRMSTQKG